MLNELYIITVDFIIIVGRESGGTGRRAGLRIQYLGNSVGVQIPPLANNMLKLMEELIARFNSSF